MCDFAVFGALKTVWKKEVQKWKLETLNREITIVDFVVILKRVQEKVMTPEKIINGFRATGIFPLDHGNCHLERCLPKNNSETSSVTLQNDEEQPSNHQEQLTDAVEKNVEKCLSSVESLGTEIEKNHPQLSLNISMIKQQLLFILQATSSSPLAQTTSIMLASPLARTTLNDASSVAHPTPIVSPSSAARFNPNESSSAIRMTLNDSSSTAHPTSIISPCPAACTNPNESSSSDSRTTQNISTSPETYPISTTSDSSTKSILKLPDPFFRPPLSGIAP